MMNTKKTTSGLVAATVAKFLQRDKTQQETQQRVLESQRGSSYKSELLSLMQIAAVPKVERPSKPRKITGTKLTHSHQNKSIDRKHCTT